jgi:hypothetical protein
MSEFYVCPIPGCHCKKATAKVNRLSTTNPWRVRNRFSVKVANEQREKKEKEKDLL